MARLLFIDPNGEGLDLSWTAQANGHKVKHFIKDEPKSLNIGENIVPVVRDFKPYLEWADFVVLCDNVLYMKDMDRARENGVEVIGATSASVRLELDRSYGQELFKKHGIETIPYKTFEDYDDAIKYVKATDARYVSKPDDDKGDKALSYVSKSPADMVYMLERWKKNDKLHGRFILQEFVGGQEIAVGGWLSNSGFIGPWCENFEFKKLMAGDLGPNTGEMGTVLSYVNESALAEAVLAPLQDALLRTGHTGYVDVNCIVGDNGVPYPLEFTMRFGWPTANIQAALHEDFTESILSCVSKEYDFSAVTDTISIGACIAIPDFPYSHITRKDVTGIPIYGLKGRILNHIHPCQMMRCKSLPNNSLMGVEYEEMFATAGDYVMVVTALGKTVQAARETLYNRIERISIPNSPMWRTDIGYKLQTVLPKLQGHGFAKTFLYAS